jgi:hypothetical protein
VGTKKTEQRAKIGVINDNGSNSGVTIAILSFLNPYSIIFK